jgi:hypothetical protein
VECDTGVKMQVECALCNKARKSVARGRARAKRLKQENRQEPSRGERRKARGKRQEARGKRQEARSERREARGNRQEAKGKRQKARDKKHGKLGKATHLKVRMKSRLRRARKIVKRDQYLIASRSGWAIKSTPRIIDK